MSGNEMEEDGGDGGTNGVQEFRSRLYELVTADENRIKLLTNLARGLIDHASSIVDIVEYRLKSAPRRTLLPIIYLMDSILKIVGNEYIPLFTKNLIKVMVRIFLCLDMEEQKELYQLRTTWQKLFPKVVLYHLDVRLNAINPMWAVVAQVHVNPMFFNNRVGSDARVSRRFVGENAREEFLRREMSRVVQELEETEKLLVEDRKNAVFPVDETSSAPSSLLIDSEKAVCPENSGSAHRASRKRPFSVELTNHLTTRSPKEAKILSASSISPLTKTNRLSGDGRLQSDEETGLKPDHDGSHSSARSHKCGSSDPNLRTQLSASMLQQSTSSTSGKSQESHAGEIIPPGTDKKEPSDTESAPSKKKKRKKKRRKIPRKRRNYPWPFKVPNACPKVLESIDCDPMGELEFDGIVREIRFYDGIAVMFPEWDDPREIRFQNCERELVINDTHRHLLHPNQPYTTIRMGDVEFTVRLGLPMRELYVNERFYTTVFNGPPVFVKIGNVEFKFNLLGETPSITYGESRKDLVLGKISVYINQTDVRPIYLDAKPQRFDIEGLPFVLEFVDGFKSIMVNSLPMKVSFDASEKPVGVFYEGRRHFLTFSPLPEGVVQGEVLVKEMKTGILDREKSSSVHKVEPEVEEVNPQVIEVESPVSESVKVESASSLPQFSKPPPLWPMLVPPPSLDTPERILGHDHSSDSPRPMLNPPPSSWPKCVPPPTTHRIVNEGQPPLLHPLIQYVPPPTVNIFNTPPPILSHLPQFSSPPIGLSPLLNLINADRPTSSSSVSSASSGNVIASGSYFPRFGHTEAFRGFQSPCPSFSERSRWISPGYFSVSYDSPQVAPSPPLFPPPNAPLGAKLNRTAGTASMGSNHINVQELLRKLQEVGMIPSASAQTSSRLPIVPVSFDDRASLRTSRQPGLIDMLHSGKQCSFCNLRFQASEDKRYGEHLDWHFRENRRLKMKTTREFYMTKNDWKEFVSCEMEEDRSLSLFEIQERLPQARMESPEEKHTAPVGGRGIIVHCDVCTDIFEQIFCEKEGEWRLVGAVEVNGKVYHSDCHRDSLKSGSGSSQRPRKLQKSSVIPYVDLSSDDEEQPSAPPAVSSEDQQQPAVPPVDTYSIHSSDTIER